MYPPASHHGSALLLKPGPFTWTCCLRHISYFLLLLPATLWHSCRHPLQPRGSSITPGQKQLRKKEQTVITTLSTSILHYHCHWLQLEAFLPHWVSILSVHKVIKILITGHYPFKFRRSESKNQIFTQFFRWLMMRWNSLPKPTFLPQPSIHGRNVLLLCFRARHKPGSPFWTLVLSILNHSCGRFSRQSWLWTKSVAASDYLVSLLFIEGK